MNDKQNKKPRFYVGVIGFMNSVVFKHHETPTEQSHGKLYAAAIGPFKTKRGAEYMAKFGHANPHLQTVADAERWSKIEDDMLKAMKDEPV